MSDLYDVTIIGGGPAGLYSAFYSGLRNMKTKIIEYQPELGGKVLLYPEKLIWDVGGQPPILGEKFAKQIVEQGLTFDPCVCTNTKVDFIEKNQEDNFVISTHDGEQHISNSIIMANGGGIINPTRLDIEGSSKYENQNLHYTIPSLKPFYQQKVLISGGGDTAIDWAHELLGIAKEVIVIYRKDNFTAHEANVTKLMNHPDSTLLNNTTIQKLIGDRQSIKQVQLLNEQSNEMSVIDVDHVVVAHGYNQEDSFNLSTDLELERKDGYFYKGNSFGCTSQEGIFAAGDIIAYEGKVHLLVGAFQDAVNAVNSAKSYIDPNATHSAIVSSHNERFKEKNQEIIKDMLNI
ncbi:NAD(P)/FAD-dependent oxidoreductase [Piscibacillus halophilus]|uniref:NAD(P)/FAD-dependent oxidoreductase n=1 Tax=Piscibacillus halophilus TaxID=571933 RepID=UPI00158BF8B0|nr:NAD(P)/FAD-dependent oxidoreductase [Piscibacillus halophilus]